MTEIPTAVAGQSLVATPIPQIGPVPVPPAIATAVAQASLIRRLPRTGDFDPSSLVFLGVSLTVVAVTRLRNRRRRN
jgi:LPXTG-motif cell wall-anchored protein